MKRSIEMHVVSVPAGHLTGELNSHQSGGVTLVPHEMLHVETIRKNEGIPVECLIRIDGGQKQTLRQIRVAELAFQRAINRQTHGITGKQSCVLHK